MYNGRNSTTWIKMRYFFYSPDVSLRQNWRTKVQQRPIKSLGKRAFSETTHISWRWAVGTLGWTRFRQQPVSPLTIVKSTTGKIITSDSVLAMRAGCHGHVTLIAYRSTITSTLCLKRARDTISGKFFICLLIYLFKNRFFFRKREMNLHGNVVSISILEPVSKVNYFKESYPIYENRSENKITWYYNQSSDRPWKPEKPGKWSFLKNFREIRAENNKFLWF